MPPLDPVAAAACLTGVGPQPGCPAHAARIAMHVASQQRVDAIRKDPQRPQRRHGLIEPLHVRHPAAEYDRIRIEYVDQVRQRARKPLFVTPHRLLAACIAARGSCLDVDGCQPQSRRRRIVALEPRTGEERFDAAGVAAKTSSTRPLVIGGPWQRIVAPLAGDSVRADEHISVHDDAAADASAENRTEYHVRVLAGAVARLRERETIGIVADSHFAAEHRFEIGPDRLPVETERVRAAKQAGRARDRPRCTDPHAATLAQLLLGFPNEAGNASQNRTIVLMRRGDPAAQQLASATRERDDFDLGAAQIDAEAQPSGTHAALLQSLLALRNCNAWG